MLIMSSLHLYMCVPIYMYTLPAAQGERLSSVASRVRSMLDVSEKDFDKVHIHACIHSCRQLDEHARISVNTSNFSGSLRL